MKSFGSVVQAKRKSLGIAQKELARKVGIARSFLCSIESGYVPPPSPAVARRISKVLRLDEDTLVLLSEVEKIDKEVRGVVVKGLRSIGFDP
jgi:transcriptional regulator with XRE-family HTH domain